MEIWYNYSFWFHDTSCSHPAGLSLMLWSWLPFLRNKREQGLLTNENTWIDSMLLLLWTCGFNTHSSISIYCGCNYYPWRTSTVTLTVWAYQDGSSVYLYWVVSMALPLRIRAHSFNLVLLLNFPPHQARGLQQRLACVLTHSFLYWMSIL